MKKIGILVLVLVAVMVAFACASTNEKTMKWQAREKVKVVEVSTEPLPESRNLQKELNFIEVVKADNAGPEVTEEVLGEVKKTIIARFVDDGWVINTSNNEETTKLYVEIPSAKGGLVANILFIKEGKTVINLFAFRLVYKSTRNPYKFDANWTESMIRTAFSERIVQVINKTIETGKIELQLSNKPNK